MKIRTETMLSEAIARLRRGSNRNAPPDPPARTLELQYSYGYMAGAAITGGILFAVVIVIGVMDALKADDRQLLLFGGLGCGLFLMLWLDMRRLAKRARTTFLDRSKMPLEGEEPDDTKHD